MLYIFLKIAFIIGTMQLQANSSQMYNERRTTMILSVEAMIVESKIKM